MLNRVLIDDFCFINTVNFVVFNNESALLINSLFNVRNGVLDCGNPFHINYLFIELTRKNIFSLIVINHVGLEIVGGKVSGEVLLHIFI